MGVFSLISKNMWGLLEGSSGLQCCLESWILSFQFWFEPALMEVLEIGSLTLIDKPPSIRSTRLHPPLREGQGTVEAFFHYFYSSCPLFPLFWSVSEADWFISSCIVEWKYLEIVSLTSSQFVIYAFKLASCRISLNDN